MNKNKTNKNKTLEQKVCNRQELVKKQFTSQIADAMGVASDFIASIGDIDASNRSTANMYGRRISALDSPLLAKLGQHYNELWDVLGCGTLVPVILPDNEIKNEIVIIGGRTDLDGTYLTHQVGRIYEKDNILVVEANYRKADLIREYIQEKLGLPTKEEAYQKDFPFEEIENRVIALGD